MAASNKNIVITPNIGNTTAFPTIVYTGNANVPMTQAVADDNSIYWSNQTGQLFSISNNLTTGTIFSVNDISGIPFVTVNASGNISLVPFGGANVGIGTASPNYPLQVQGNIFTTASAWHGNLAITNTTAATSTTTGALTVTGGVGIGGNIFAGIGGNVGIGTSSVVSGNAISIYGGNVFVAGNIRISNTAAQFGGIVFPDGSFQNTAVTGVTLANDTATNAPRYINFSNTTTGTASVLYASNPGLVYYPVNGNLVIGGNLTVSNAVGISTFAGNVGIGTTTSVPGYILSVSGGLAATDRKSTRLNSSHSQQSRMPSSA